MRSRKGCGSPGECLWNAGVLSHWEVLSTICVCQGSCWSQRPTLGANITSGCAEAGQEGSSSLVGGPSQHLWEETQVSPERSSAQLCKEFIAMGSGSKHDVFSHGFLIRAIPLCPKNAISPAFPSLFCLLTTLPLPTHTYTYGVHQ